MDVGLESFKNIFYVYLHIDPIDKHVYYVGKGKNNRAYNLVQRSGLHKKWINELKLFNLKPEIVIHTSNLTEQEAFVKEIELIALHRSNNKLLNGTMGGSGGNTSINKTSHAREKVVFCVETGIEYINKREAAKACGLTVKEIEKRLLKTSQRKPGILNFRFKDRPNFIKLSKIARKGKILTSEGQVFEKVVDFEKFFKLTGGVAWNVLSNKSRFIKLKDRLITIWYEGEEPKPVPDEILTNFPNKPVFCETNGKYYKSAKSAAKDINISHKHITCVCKGKRDHHFNYRFKYVTLKEFYEQNQEVT